MVGPVLAFVAEVETCASELLAAEVTAGCRSVRPTRVTDDNYIAPLQQGQIDAHVHLLSRIRLRPAGSTCLMLSTRFRVADVNVDDCSAACAAR